MKNWWALALCSSVAVLGTVSTAQAAGFELGARLGYGVPLGKADADSDLSDGIAGMIPLQLDVGYRLPNGLSLGGYFMYGPGFAGDVISDVCDIAEVTPGVSADCYARDLRLGFQALYHFSPAAKLDPWLGAGIGYEWVTFGADVSGGGASTDVSSTGKGFEFINLQGGLDFELAKGFALGPFLSFSVGQLSSYSASCSGNVCIGASLDDGDIRDKAMHQWLLLGARGTFVLGDQP